MAVLAALSEPLGRALRACARIDARRWVATDVGAGLLLFGAGGELSSINDEALHWLGALPDTRLPDPARPLEIELPPSVAGVVLRARGAFPDGDGAGAWGRVQSRSCRWLVCHASALRDAGGGVTGTALVIGPARTTDLAPIIVEAHELTAREQEIARLIARGVSTAEIAGRLYLSTHTVRDHIKATFEKLDVSSRGELVAKLFAEPHEPAPAAAS
ncbi:MAG TPA: helix-turn-helix transcriptional regulator [Acidimicrobiales bacterium]|nr:helix-turn-helix transcriptional regulator [Acidimicrobiales bacterium]